MNDILRFHVLDDDDVVGRGAYWRSGTVVIEDEDGGIRVHQGDRGTDVLEDMDVDFVDGPTAADGDDPPDVPLEDHPTD